MILAPRHPIAFILRAGLILLLVTFFVSCEDSSSAEPNRFSVEGTILYRGMPFENVRVTLNGSSLQTATTNANGLFKITDVPPGEHTLTSSRVFDDGTFIERSNTILVDGDIFLDPQVLPRAVQLYPPINTTDNSSHITWSPTDAADFREYKLYRHLSSGLDETTGELIHISTSVNDTIFTDQHLNTLTDYYYRIFVMNDYGLLGGSNIVSTTTLERNLFPDGSFESSQDPNQHWKLEYGTPSALTISDSLAHDGAYSLSLDLPLAISHDLMPGVEAGEIYELSFWYRLTGDSIAYDQLDDRSYTVDHFGGDHIYFDMFGTFTDLDEGPGFDSGWLLYQANLSMRDDKPLLFYLTLGASTDLNMWFDEFSLVKVVF